MDFQKFTLYPGPRYPRVIGTVIDPVGGVGMDNLDMVLA